MLARKLLILRKQMDKGKSSERMRRKAADLKLRFQVFFMIAELPNKEKRS